MFTKIEEYMQLDRDERRAHLKLEEACIEIGGHSKYFKGLLAHHLRTTIPWKQKIMVCHACNNADCSNPNHLYWGTYQDNHIDKVECGRFSFQKELAVRLGPEHYRKVALKIVETKRNNGTFDKLSLSAEELEKYKMCISKYDISKFGWVGKFANEIGVSHTQVKRICKKYFSHIEFYERKSPT